ncbi:hypothetical protein DSL72_006539 [Monilinia vaccinii-corymbosi]|uniref:Uncharacterized protein n=1 Tax=Monilinia vaccinii-corymbosi TaxID=61207 RepID=A0A8A3PMM9_9HELO|nr:hypothetical protein DSL72_006539 [Monilinia vaccinii-corymbosi]
MDEAFEILDHPDGYRVSELGGDRRSIQPLIAAMQLTVQENERNQKGPIFHADLSLSDPAGKDFGMNIIYEMFSRGLPGKRRKESCDICETFIKDFGNLCYLSDNATLVPLVWPEEDIVPEYYRRAVANVRKLFEGRPLGEEFRHHLETRKHWSAYKARKSHKTDTYDHMDVDMLGDSRSRYAPTQSEELTEILERIVADNDEATIDRTYKMLIHDILPHAKSCKKWIVWIKNAVAAIKVRNNLGRKDRRALMARYASLAAEGCLASLRNGELAQLMSCVKVGEEIRTIIPKWIQLVNPQDVSPEDMARTTSRLISDMGYNTTCFYRSFIKLSQIPSSVQLWVDSLKPSSIPQLSSFRSPHPARSSIPALTTLPDALNRAPIKQICFRKFCLEVLPQIISLSIHMTKESKHAENLHFLTTGLDDPTGRTKPTFSFQEPGRHTASWFKATHITSPEQANLHAEWVQVKCIVSFPHMWDHIQVRQKPVADFFDPMVERGFAKNGMGMKFLLVLDGIDDHHAKGSDLSNGFLNQELKYFSREQVEMYRDYKSMRGSYTRGHVGGVGVGYTSKKFRSVMLGVKTKNGEFVRYEVVQYKYLMA